MMNKKILLLLVVLFGIFSCKDSDVMPRIVSANADSNTEADYTKPPKYKYEGPTTQLGVDITVSTNDVVLSKSRTMILDQKDVQHNGGTQKNVAVRWVKGDKYKLMTCIRYVKANSADWRPQYGTAIGTVIEDPTDSNNLLLKLDGSMDIANDQLQSHTHGSIVFNEPDNWYFGAIILEKIEGENTGSFGTAIEEDNKPVKLKVSPRTKLIAVGNDDDNFSMDNVPLGIPFHKVRIDEKDNIVPNGGSFKVRPIGNIVNFKLTNDFAFPVLVSRDMKVKVNSKMIFKQGMELDFWQYGHKTKFIGTNDFVFHYDNSDRSGAFIGGILKPTYSEIDIDWSQAINTTKVTQNGKEYTKLKSGETVNLYIWTMMNVNYDGASAPIEVDYRDVDLQVPVYSYVGNTTNVIYKPAMNHAGGTNLGDLAIFGYKKETKEEDPQGPTPSEPFDGEQLSISYFKFKSASNISFNDGRTYTIPMSLHSDLIISEIYYKWGDSNTGIFEFYNPNRYSVNLSDYYLARIRYDNFRYGNYYNYWDRGSLVFRSTDWQDDKRFQYALLMPLDLNNKYEMTAAGNDRNRPLYNDFWQATYYGNKKKYWDEATEGANNLYITRPRLAFPSNKSIDYKPSTIPGGVAFAYGGYGVYRRAANRAESEYDGAPNKLGWLWGIWDGLGSKENASTTEKQSGVMNRNHDQGWALVKKIGDKCYIIDTFGPTREKGLEPSMFDRNFFLQMFGQNVRYWSMRNQQVVFPQGRNMYRDQWHRTEDMNSEHANIGARARYNSAGTHPTELPQ